MSFTSARLWRIAGPGGSSDVSVAVVLFALALATLHMSPRGTDAWGLGGVAISAGMCAILPGVRRHPIAVLPVMIGLFLVAQAVYGLVPILAITLLVAVFVVASSDATARRTTIAAAVAVSAVIDTSAALTRYDSWTDSAYLVMATAALGAAAAGDAVRSRRAYVREVEDRARRAEQSREQLLARRITEERLSIARDMHDLVAHQLAVISVQAEVSNRLIDTRPDMAKASLGRVHDAAASALGELGSLIGVLRHGDDAPGLPIEPAPDLGQLPALTASFESIGLQITRIQRGNRRPLPPAVDLTAYRLVQESLTNAHKHGTGRAALTIGYGTGELVIDVVNAVRGPHAASADGGHGLLGMRERVAAVGGSLRAGPTGAGQFHVRASLPFTSVAADL